MDLELLDKSIRRVPDFPKPGILFYDITSVFLQPEAFNFVIDKMVEVYKDKKIDAVAAVESRGFLFAASIRPSCSSYTQKGKASFGYLFLQLFS